MVKRQKQTSPDFAQKFDSTHLLSKIKVNLHHTSSYEPSGCEVYHLSKGCLLSKSQALGSPIHAISKIKLLDTNVPHQACKTELLDFSQAFSQIILQEKVWSDISGVNPQFPVLRLILCAP